MWDGGCAHVWRPGDPGWHFSDTVHLASLIGLENASLTNMSSQRVQGSASASVSASPVLEFESVSHTWLWANIFGNWSQVLTKQACESPQVCSCWFLKSGHIQSSIFGVQYGTPMHQFTRVNLKWAIPDPSRLTGVLYGESIPGLFTQFLWNFQHIILSVSQVLVSPICFFSYLFSPYKMAHDEAATRQQYSPNKWSRCLHREPWGPLPENLLDSIMNH